MFEWIGQTSVLSWIGSNLSLFLVLAGAGLMFAEAFAPGAHFVVLGVALLVAGLVGLLLPPGLGVLAPLILAGLVLGAGGAALYVYRQFDFYGGKGTDQTSDSDSLRGKTGRVTERVSRSGGEVKLDGGGFNPYYRAESVDGEIEEGTEVMVVDPGGGNVLTVEPLAGGVDDIDRALARERQREGTATDDEGAATDGEGTAIDDAAADSDGESGGSESEDSDRDREFETDTA
ncbi:NfeD family protein [Halosimplex halophilum]|uniref:NfeD family protein n=1 Tax=Halosimplex halophilum TaxID=2559572 RepID=UPI00107F731B|nr:NfeD family protein [Halosimplex halophilum]